MNYETAKKLKENGFPIKDRTFSVECECNHEDITLSELIEAVGDELGMWKYKDKVICFNTGNPLESSIKVEGSTPEEAVANLYLALKGSLE